MDVCSCNIFSLNLLHSRDGRKVKFDCHISSCTSYLCISCHIRIISSHIRFKSFQIYAFHSHRICVSHLMILSHPLSASLVPSILTAARAMAEHVRSTSAHRRRWLRQFLLLTCLVCVASFSSFTGTLGDDF